MVRLPSRPSKVRRSVIGVVFIERVRTGEKEVTGKVVVGNVTMTVKSVLGTIPIEDLLFTVAANRLSQALQQEQAR